MNGINCTLIQGHAYYKIKEINNYKYKRILCSYLIKDKCNWLNNYLHYANKICI